MKAKICLQILTGSKTTAVVCRENQLNENVVSRWKKQFIENASLIFEKESVQSGESERVAELERLVGRLTMELEIAKKVSMSVGLLSKRSVR